MITELQARAMSVTELAASLADNHSDPTVRYFARRILNDSDEAAQETFEYLHNVRQRLEIRDAKK
jgi:hypothetical protein